MLAASMARHLLNAKQVPCQAGGQRVGRLARFLLSRSIFRARILAWFLLCSIAVFGTPLAVQHFSCHTLASFLLSRVVRRKGTWARHAL
jgi:hypothetical protein